MPCHWCRLKCKFDNLKKTLGAKERLDMCTRTGIKNVYWGDQGLAPGMAERSECYGISAGLNIDDSDERSTPELRREVCMKTGTKDEYQNWD